MLSQSFHFVYNIDFSFIISKVSDFCHNILVYLKFVISYYHSIENKREWVWYVLINVLDHGLGLIFAVRKKFIWFLDSYFSPSTLW